LVELTRLRACELPVRLCFVPLLESCRPAKVFDDEAPRDSANKTRQPFGLPHLARPNLEQRQPEGFLIGVGGRGRICQRLSDDD